MSDLVRILHAINSVRADHGGPSRSVPGLVKALDGLGVDARLHVADRDGRLPKLLGACLLHNHGIWLLSNHAAVQAARRAGVPLVISPRGMLEPWALSHRLWKKRLAWHLYQRVDLASAAVLHATSEAEAEAIRASGLTAPIAVIPNGIDLPDALPIRTAGERRRALFLSRLHPVKGVSMLIEAWARVRPVGWELVLAGPEEGSHGHELLSQVEGAGLSQTITFHGPVSNEDKWGLYRSADLFVLPTFSENFGLVVAEALAAGVPVITTKGAPWDVLTREKAGWWVAPEVNAIEMALAEALSQDTEVLRAMGERGQRYAQHTFEWPVIACTMLEVYRWVLGKGHRPDCVR